MSRKTPLVVDGLLHNPENSLTIALASPDWQAWLAEEAHCSFHFRHPAGEFTARKEHKQRGGAYWVAYRQAHNLLFKRYVGKADTLTEAHLVAIAIALTQACGGPLNQSDP
jgi:LuxR family transcriptional regulator, maltose regulon positive regulatory protein